MRSRSKDLFVGGIVILGFIVLGFTRDFLFENINFQLYKLWYGAEEYHLPPSLGFFENWDADSLYYLKFPLTIVTVLIFFGMAHFTVWYYFRERGYIWLNLAAHSLFLLIGGLSYLYGVLFDDFNNGYHFSRLFLEFLQSPLLLMIILPACSLKGKVQK